MASKVQVIDEFLPPHHWENLLNNMGLNGKSNNFPWFYMPYVTYNDTHYMELEKESAGQFTHRSASEIACKAPLFPYLPAEHGLHAPTSLACS